MILFLPLVLAALFPAGRAWAAEAGRDAAAKDAPIIVTAKSLVADNKKKTAIYRKDVVVKKGDITLYADEVEIKFAPGKEKADPGNKQEPFQASGKVDTIEARGGVKIIQQDKTVTAKEAVYYNAQEKIVFTGSPRVWQGDNVLSGNRISYDIKGDTFQVDDAKTVLYQEDKVRPGAGTGK